jgi:competence protein ComEC
VWFFISVSICILIAMTPLDVAQDKFFRKNLKWYLLITLFLANFLIWHTIFNESKDGILSVAFLDVGQGDALLIETPQGQQVLIDGGRGRAVLQQLGEVMPFYDRFIDVVIATHPDQDHIGGLPYVLTRYDVGMVVESGATSDTEAYEALEKTIEENAIKSIVARRGMKLALSDSAYLLFLFPDRDVSNMHPNEASIVAKLVFGDTSFLFTGDSPKKIENYIANKHNELLNVDVLKVSHHGSKTSSSELFVGYSSPEYAVISVGEGNRYGHPNEEVLATLAQFDINVLRTDVDGTVIMESDGSRLYLR